MVAERLFWRTLKEIVLANNLGRDKPCPYKYQRAVARWSQLAIKTCEPF